jgi:hypothetical protein
MEEIPIHYGKEMQQTYGYIFIILSEPALSHVDRDDSRDQPSSLSGGQNKGFLQVHSHKHIVFTFCTDIEMNGGKQTTLAGMSTQFFDYLSLIYCLISWHFRLPVFGFGFGFGCFSPWRKIQSIW